MILHPRVTRSLVERVKQFEGYRRTAAPIGDGRFTVGYGHTRSARADVEVSPQDAEALLYYDLSLTAAAVEELCLTTLSAPQFEAATAFAFNVGIENFRTSDVLALINEGRLLDAGSAMEAWRQADVQGRTLVLDAFVRRRASDKALFLTPDGGFARTSTPLVAPKRDPAFAPASAAPAAPAAPEREGGRPGEDGTAGERETNRFNVLVSRLKACEQLKTQTEARAADAAPSADPPPVEGGPPPFPAALAPFGATGTGEGPRGARARRRDAARPARPASPAVGRVRLFLAVSAFIAGLAAFGYGLVATLGASPGPPGLALGLFGILLATVAGGYVLRRRAATAAARRV